MQNSQTLERLMIIWEDINNPISCNEFRLKTLEGLCLLRSLLPQKNWSISKMEPLINPYIDLLQNKIPNSQDWDMAMKIIREHYSV